MIKNVLILEDNRNTLYSLKQADVFVLGIILGAGENGDTSGIRFAQK